MANPTRPNVAGSVVSTPISLHPFTSVNPAKVFAAFVNTQPLTVPASTELGPMEDIVNVPPESPAKMLPSQLIGVPTGSIVALPVVASVPSAPPMIQKMLLASAPFSRVNVIALFTVKDPST